MQELKDEIHDIFRQTSFNGKKIFRVSYVPEIKTRPTDFQVFNSADGEYGGILVNNLRYSWAELEQKAVSSSGNSKLFKDDGKTFVGGRYTFHDYTGEKITFDTAQNGQAPNISRLYEWEARDNGIYINDLLATTWQDLGITGNSAIKERYTFTFHGMEISFNTEEGDNCLQDIKDGINSTDFNSMVTWSGVNAGVYGESAAELTSYNSGNMVVKDAWKNHTSDLRIIADDTGITLYNNEKDAQNNDVKYKFSSMKWEDFRNINGGADAYPIVDWGSGIDGMNQSNITLNHDAIYRFQDSITGFYFTFQLSDEASLSEVKKGMSVNLTESYYAPVQMTYTPTSNAYFSVDNVTTPTVLYQTQLKTNKSFDNWNTNEFVTDLKAQYNSSTNQYNIMFNLCDNRGNIVAQRMTSVKHDDFYRNVINGTSQTFYLTSDNAGDGGMGNFSFRFQSQKFQMTQSQEAAATSAAQKAKNLREIALSEAEKTKYIAAGHTEGEFQTYWQTRKTQDEIVNQLNYEYNSKYREYVTSYQNEYVNKSLSYLSGINFNLKNTQQPTMKLGMALNQNASQHTEFSTVINPPERYMYIQSGANEGEDTKIIWTGLNLSAIGMGDADTSTRTQAINTITATYRATEILSSVRSRFGAYENRLMAQYTGNQYYKENLEKSESAIRDTDMATEAVEQAKSSILENISQAMIVQANKNAQSVLDLLRV